MIKLNVFLSGYTNVDWGNMYEHKVGKKQGTHKDTIVVTLYLSD